MVARDADLLSRQASEEAECVVRSMVVAPLLLRLPLLDQARVAERGQVEEIEPSLEWEQEREESRKVLSPVRKTVAAERGKSSSSVVSATSFALLVRRTYLARIMGSSSCRPSLAVSLLLTNAVSVIKEGLGLVASASELRACRTRKSRRILACAESAGTEDGTAVADEGSRVEGSGVLLESGKAGREGGQFKQHR